MGDRYQMSEMKRFQRPPYVPSQEIFERTRQTIELNLKEMESIAQKVAAKKELLPTEDVNLLFYLGSWLYDFYLLTEECLLMIARIMDKWVPSSLDWHERLITQLQNPVPEKRPPVLSATSASMLMDYLYFYVNFHRRCSSQSFSRVENMAANLKPLLINLQKDLRSFALFLEMVQRMKR